MGMFGLSLDYLSLFGVVSITMIILHMLYLRFSFIIVASEGAFFLVITSVLWLITTLNILVYKNLLYVVHYDLTYFTIVNLDLGSIPSNLLLSYSQVLFIWESWLVIDSYSYPFVYTFLVVIALSFINCLSYHRDELRSFILFLQLIIIAGFIVFTTNSMILFFLAYEALLVPSFMILYRFAKSRRCVEAAYAMFFWTQFGALLIIFAFVYIFHSTLSGDFLLLSITNFTSVEINFLCLLLFFGFGVKFPIWPFYGWLPKAHVEASANFSIFLSGVLVKFAFFGLLKCLYVLELDPSFIWLYPFLTWGIFEVISRIFFQIDLKKLIAYVTTVEMHWLAICMVTGNSPLWISGACMLISHALISTNSFLILDAITRRFHTRLITEISGLSFIAPQLFIIAFVNLILNLGFPGSLFFIAESLFFTFMFDLWPLAAFYFFLFLYLFGPLFYFKGWVNTLFSYSYLLSRTLPLDITLRESFLFFGIPVLLYWLGVTWPIFIF